MVDQTDTKRYIERLTFTAASRVRNAGYITGSLKHNGPSTIRYSDIGFAIYKTIIKEWKFFFIKNETELLYLIADLYLYNIEDHTLPRDRWKLYVRGHENVTDLSDLVSKIAAEHNVGLDVELIEERPFHFVKDTYGTDWHSV